MQKQDLKNQANIPIPELKEQVKAYWNKASCGTEFINEQKFSRTYFEEIERFRYTIEPEIFAFAQFTRFHNKKVLEVGVGAGTDFVQWVRAGAHAHGIDLTQEAIDNVQHRLKLCHPELAYSSCAHPELVEGERKNICDIRVADAEKLPYENNFFDLVYSWGVIHHSPDTVQCLREIIRVTKPGGAIKVMIYNRRSLFAFYRYLLCALFRGNPFKSFKTVLFQDQESPGTKAYTQKEVREILTGLPVNIVHIKSTVSNHDLLYYKNKFIRFFAYSAACLLGWNRVGWFMTIELLKK